MALSIPIFASLADVFTLEERAIEYLFDNYVLEVRHEYHRCASQVERVGKKWKCTSRPCRTSQTIFKDSFFQQSKLPVNLILHFAYLWLSGACRNTIITHTGVSSATAVNWTHYLQQLLDFDLASLPQDDAKIGGYHCIVEIDESKFGKRKYNRGHHIGGAWVLGGICRETKDVFACVVPDRSKETLMDKISQFVHEGTTIYTDFWKGYSDEELGMLGMYHDKVNHSLHFVDPNTHVHTNTIEATWNAMKYHIPYRHRTAELIQEDITEYVWRKKYKDNLWERLLHAMQNVVYEEGIYQVPQH